MDDQFPIDFAIAFKFPPNAYTISMRSMWFLYKCSDPLYNQ